MTVRELLKKIPDNSSVGIDINGTVNIFKRFDWVYEKNLNFVLNRTVLAVTSEYEEFLDDEENGDNKTFIQIVIQ